MRSASTNRSADLSSGRAPQNPAAAAQSGGAKTKNPTSGRRIGKLQQATTNKFESVAGMPRTGTKRVAEIYGSHLLAPGA